MSGGSVCILVNSKSGQKRQRNRVDELRELAAGLGARVEVRRLERTPGLAKQTEQAVRDGFDTIVAAGGDGTICGVAEALRGTGATLGILPMGTFNYFARSLGIPDELEGAMDVIATGRPEPMRVAAINGRAFLNNTSLGAYAAILDEREDIYSRWGRSRVAAYFSVVKALMTWRSPIKATIRIDGEAREVRTPLIFVVNNAFQLDMIGLEGRECIEAGEQVVFVAPDSGRWGMMRHAFALATGLAIPKRNYDKFCGREIVIETLRASQLTARDGERERMEGPYRISVDPAALDVIVPRDREAQVR